MHQERSFGHTQRGFTILEIVIAIAVLALLAGTIVPMVGSTMADSKRAQAQAEVKAITEAIGRYKLDTGLYPPGLQNNPALNSGSTDQSSLSLTTTLVHGTKKYLSKTITRDPWDRPYVYSINTAPGAIVDVYVLSLGPDGVMTTNAMQLNQSTVAGDDIASFFDL
jgi:general secretion pathway protein G